jgi:hypothetical protein
MPLTNDLGGGGGGIITTDYTPKEPVYNLDPLYPVDPIYPVDPVLPLCTVENGCQQPVYTIDPPPPPPPPPPPIYDPGNGDEILPPPPPPPMPIDPGGTPEANIDVLPADLASGDPLAPPAAIPGP